MRAIVIRFHTAFRIIGVYVEGIEVSTYLLDRFKVLVGDRSMSVHGNQWEAFNVS